MGSVTDAVEVDLLKMLTGQPTTIFTTTPITNLYCALTTTTPTDSAAGTEHGATGGYARVQTVGKWGTPSAGSVANNAIIDFGTASGNWSAVVGFELYTASSGGTRIAWGTLTASKTPQTGDPVNFPVGALVITAD